MTEKVREQIMRIRKSGIVNMCDCVGDQRAAFDLGFYELVNYIEENRNTYFHFIITGEILK